jgi:hypothetical protein
MVLTSQGWAPWANILRPLRGLPRRPLSHFHLVSRAKDPRRQRGRGLYVGWPGRNSGLAAGLTKVHGSDSLFRVNSKVRTFAEMMYAHDFECAWNLLNKVKD